MIVLNSNFYEIGYLCNDKSMFYLVKMLENIIQ